MKILIIVFEYQQVLSTGFTTLGIINKTSITTIVFFDFAIQPNLKVFFVLVKKRETTINIRQRIVCFFKELFSVIERRFL